MALQSTVAIASLTLQAATTTVTFSGIPNTYRDLLLVTNHLGTANSTGGELRFNLDSTASYSRVFFFSLGSGGGAGSGSGMTSADIFFPRTIAGLATFQMLDYAVTDKHKVVLNRTDASDYACWVGAARWAKTEAINTVSLTPGTGQWAAGATFSLYGRVA